MSEGQKMEAVKRKLGQNDDARAEAQKKVREHNGEQTDATEEEVDEFFAIIRRIQVAVNYFQKSNGGRHLTKRGALEFASINVENNSVTDEKKKGAKDAEKNIVLDLNADPVMDPDNF